MLAKIGDQVGINMWASQSRYRATIQDALDYVMQESPGGESIQSLLPHVASVAVAYGDPNKQYANFIATQDTGAAHRTWFWHDVPGAFGPKNKLLHQRRSPTDDDDKDDSGVLHRLGRVMYRRSATASKMMQQRDDELPTANATGVVWAPGEEPVRPDIFGLTGNDEVELDDGVYVSWDDIRPYYAAIRPTDVGSEANTTTESGAMNDSASASEGVTANKRRRRLSPGPARVRVW